MANLFTGYPSQLPEEVIDVLIESANVRIERIVSTNHHSPKDFWYDQTEHEWVVLLRGEASLRFEDDLRPQILRPGDYVAIPPHCRHRVDSTSKDEPTVWLAVFY